MTPVETSPVASGLEAAVSAKLQNAEAPLKVSEVTKGLVKPKGVKATAFQEDVRAVVEEQVRLGRAFSSPSGKGGAVRYWSRDERHILREKAVELAAIPQPLLALKTALGKEVKGLDGAFVEAVVRELIGDDRLFEYPPKSKKGGPLFGASPPPPPLPVLEQGKHKKAVDKLIADCRKLLAAAGVPAEELFQMLRAKVQDRPAEGKGGAIPPDLATDNVPVMQPTAEGTPAASADLGELILKAVSNSPVLSLADLRREMPLEFRGTAFDQAVLRLADERQVVLSQDADPSRFSEAERAEYVQDGGIVFTTISKWS